MPNITPEQLRERYQKLPFDVQEAYFSVKTGEILQKIGKENMLSTEKIGIIADETGLLMLGLTHPNEFIPNLTKRIGIDRELAKKIAYKINEEVFVKIRESLRKIHKTKEKKKRTDTPIKKESIVEARVIPTMIKPFSAFVEKPNKNSLDIEEISDITKEETKNKEIATDKKEIFEERKKVFRSSPTETVIKEEKPKYQEGPDPYREPIN